MMLNEDYPAAARYLLRTAADFLFDSAATDTPADIAASAHQHVASRMPGRGARDRDHGHQRDVAVRRRKKRRLRKYIHRAAV